MEGEKIPWSVSQALPTFHNFSFISHRYSKQLKIKSETLVFFSTLHTLYKFNDYFQPKMIGLEDTQEFLQIAVVKSRKELFVGAEVEVGGSLEHGRLEMKDLQ